MLDPHTLTAHSNRLLFLANSWEKTDGVRLFPAWDLESKMVDLIGPLGLVDLCVICDRAGTAPWSLLAQGGLLDLLLHNIAARSCSARQICVIYVYAGHAAVFIQICSRSSVTRLAGLCSAKPAKGSALSEALPAPLSSEHGTHKTVMARFWPWLERFSGESA